MSLQVQNDLGPCLFTFAVITDTHLNQGEDECNSPFEVNRLANARMRHVVQELNGRDVSFVIHLGDLVHPVPAIPHLYERAVAQFKEQVAELRHPLHVIPGNHDVGDKPTDWAPASAVSDAFLSLWDQHFGDDHYAFEREDCHFVFLNAQIINSGLDSEAVQRSWLEGYLDACHGERIYLNIHYPPYLTERHEGEHYDNIAEPGRSWLLELLERHKVEALFAGHVHNFWYHRHGATECYLLPSTAFARQDYSEMYRVAPTPEMEAGRNDAPKLGYFLVNVHQRGHACHVVRTYGLAAEPGVPAPIPVERVRPLLPRENWRAPLGFDMRQSWMDVVEIPPSGGLDEFDRKQARNDYSLMALWEMGVRRLRIPASDLFDPVRRERLAVLRDHGHRFTLFSYGMPDERLHEILTAAPSLMDAWEVAASLADLGRVLEAAAHIRGGANVLLYASKLRSKDDLERGGEKYYHMINHGFAADDAAEIASLAQLGNVDGVVFRVAGAASPWETVLTVGPLCETMGIRGSLHLRMGASNPAAASRDDLWAANRIAEALAASATRDNLHAFADTFSDIDRGYFVRNGVVDRLYNPRLGFHVVRHLYAALNRDRAPLSLGGLVPFDGGRAAELGSATRDMALVLPDGPLSSASLPANPGRATAGWQLVDLSNGEVQAQEPVAAGNGELRFPFSRTLEAPALLICPRA